jgi:hypothetical protein
MALPLCRDCRFCRPAWGALINPFLWPFWPIWRQFWTSAKCRHPTSLPDRPPPDLVVGYRAKARREYCTVARSSDYNERCGPRARYWEARRYPAWLWTLGSATAGGAVGIAYFGFLFWIVRS